MGEMTREERDGWTKWLGGMRWTFVATGTWKETVTRSTSQRTVDRWLSVFPEAFAAVGIQRGPTSETIHVHLMIGGVNPVAACRLRHSWVKRGHVLVKRYDPRDGGIAYMVNQAEDIRLIGTLQPFTPRRKRR